MLCQDRPQLAPRLQAARPPSFSTPPDPLRSRKVRARPCPPKHPAFSIPPVVCRAVRMARPSKFATGKHMDDRVFGRRPQDRATLRRNSAPSRPPGALAVPRGRRVSGKYPRFRRMPRRARQQHRAAPGRGNDQRNMRGLFVVRVLRPHAMIAEMPAVIAPEDDDRVFGKTEFVQSREHLSDLRIHVTHCGMITMDERPRLCLVERPTLRDVAILPQFAPSSWRKFRRAFRRSSSTPPVRTSRDRTCSQYFFGAQKRQMRLEKAHGDKPWLLRVVLRRPQPLDSPPPRSSHQDRHHPPHPRPQTPRRAGASRHRSRRWQRMPLPVSAHLSRDFPATMYATDFACQCGTVQEAGSS